MEDKYISVSDYAAFVGKTTQHVYNLLHQGIITGFEFSRGKMKGWLVQKPVGFDEWKDQQKDKEQNN